MAAYADDLIKLLDRVLWHKAVVAGMSMGGYVAFELLRRYRDRVAGLILCDTKAEADTEDGKKGRDEMAAPADPAAAGPPGEGHDRPGRGARRRRGAARDARPPRLHAAARDD